MKLHRKLATAFIAITAIQASAHPVPESDQWLTFEGDEGPGKGKHIVFVSADQEYRSEQSMPMMAALLAKHHGFDTTVLFGLNKDGLVDPTLEVYPKKGEKEVKEIYNIAGTEYLAKADALVLYTRMVTLPDDQMQDFADYFDSGKPVIALRTANHGFRSKLPYEIDGKQVKIADIVGGAFMKHHGNWHADSTRGDIVPEMKDHPILTGVTDIWGPSDVYRTYPEGGSLPEGCTALVMGQPLIGREKGGKDNPEKIPLPVVWFKNWETSKGEKARVLHSTMGSARDLESEGLRRLVINGIYWGLNMEDQIKPDSSVEYVGKYEPLPAGFNYEKLGVKPQKPETYRPKP